MADDKKYYYIRLKENFFDSPELIAVESMSNGYIYSNILLKLYLKSLRFDGKLMITERIPYTPDVLASVTRHSVGDVKEALKVFSELELIEILDTGAIYMLDIQDFVGQTTTESDRKRAYRNRIDREKTGESFLIEDKSLDKCPDKSPDKTPPENRVKSLEKENKKDNSQKSKKRIYDVDSIHYQLAEYLFEEMKKNNPEVKEPKLNDWANDIRLMMEIDNRKEEQVRNMIIWSQSNDFWKGVILSAKKLRDRYDQMKVQANQPYKNNNAAAQKNDSVKYDIKASEFFTMPEGYSFDD